MTYLDVATAQTAALAHKRAVTQLAGARLNATLNLVKSLGASWSDESRNPKERD